MEPGFNQRADELAAQSHLDEAKTPAPSDAPVAQKRFNLEEIREALSQEVESDLDGLCLYANPVCFSINDDLESVYYGPGLHGIRLKNPPKFSQWQPEPPANNPAPPAPSPPKKR